MSPPTRRHGTSDAVRQFEAVYGPELVNGPVVFTDYVLIATNRGRYPAAARRASADGDRGVML